MARTGRNELAQIFKTFQILAQSQVGFEARQLQSKSKEDFLRIAVNGGNIVRPFDESSNSSNAERRYGLFFNFTCFRSSSTGSSFLDLPRDAFERVDVVTTGFATFARLLSSGVYPGTLLTKVNKTIGLGSGGFVVEHEAVTNAVPNPEVMHESSAPLSTPTVEINASSEGITPEEEAYLIKAAREVGVIFPKPR